MIDRSGMFVCSVKSTVKSKDEWLRGGEVLEEQAHVTSDKDTSLTHLLLPLFPLR